VARTRSIMVAEDCSASASEVAELRACLDVEPEDGDAPALAARRLLECLVDAAAEPGVRTAAWLRQLEDAGAAQAAHAAAAGIPPAAFLQMIDRLRHQLDGTAGDLVALMLDRVVAGVSRELAWAGGPVSAAGSRMVALGRLAAGIAHEINNPCAFILPNLEFMIEELTALRAQMGGASLDDLLEAARQTLEGARRVRRVVHALRAFSPPEGLILRAVDLREAACVALADSAQALRPCPGRLVEIGAVAPVRADLALLVKMVQQLLSGALAALRGSEADRVRLRVFGDAGGSHVEVEDTGAGIPAEVRDNLLDPLLSARPVGGGVGLILSVCTHIASALGGALELDSVVGRGTRVRLSMPPMGELPASGPRVLVVGGDIDAARWWRALPACHLLLVDRAAVALEALAGGAVDLVLCARADVAALRPAAACPVEVVDSAVVPPSPDQLTAMLAA
jgi:two-component system, NtrC family, sensor kinase